MKAFFVYLFVFSCYTSYLLVSSCGITTHTEIAHRAASHYEYLLENTTRTSDLIKKYQSAFQAGNPYPDSFFPTICKNGSFHYVSEDTHWVPFINATINYIHKTYTKPYNEDALRLIVFLMGFTSHQIADVNWHSLGIDEGFLSAMGFVNFHGSFDEAHLAGDVGSDIVNQFELNTKYIADLGDWYIPYKDLYNIYVQYYGTEIVTEADIIECSSLLFLGRLGEQLAISLLYSDYSRKSPFITNKLNDYYLGGMDDMATWTQLSWNKVLYMLENGLDKCYLDHNILFVTCDNHTLNGQVGEKPKDAYRKHLSSFREEYVVDESYAKFVYSQHGVTFQASDKFKHELRSRLSTKAVTSERVEGNQMLSSNASYFVLNDYATFGWSLASGDLNGDHSDDLIVGAPVYSFQNAYQNGLVFVKYSQNGALPMLNLNMETSADKFIYAPDLASNNTRFGHSVLVLDLNQDGFNDIIVSAPSYNLEKIEYQGRVYVYFGNAKQDYSNPSIVITCENYRYCNLGWTLSKGDVNDDSLDDLIISSPYATTCGPQCGFVGVLFSAKKDYPGVIPVVNLDWSLHGNMIYEWFGFSVKARFGYLAVGAPESRLCKNADCSMSKDDLQAIGRVYLYKFPSSNPILALQGDEEFSQFGYDLDLSAQLQDKRNVLAVSSYTKNCRIEKAGSLELNQGGVVQVFDVSNIANATEITLLKSDRAYSGFGSVVKFADVNADGSEELFIGAQLRTETLIAVSQVEQGAFYMFEGGAQFPTGNITDDCPFTDLTPCPAQKASTVFANTATQSRFGHSFALLRSSTGNVQVAISASRSDNGLSRLSGKINLFSIVSRK